MRKKIFKQTWAQKAVALGLSAAMVVPSSVAYLGTTTTMAAELPTPVAVYEAGQTQDLDAAGKNKPDVVNAPELWDGGKAWSLKDSIPEAAPSTTTTKSSDSSITVKNPFAGDKTLVEDLQLSSKGLPMWNTGVTITYWVKTLGDYDKTSPVVSFTSEGVKTYEKNSLLKHRIASGYSAEKAMDPKSEYYNYQLPEKFNGKPVYDFYEFAKAKGIDVNDPFALSESSAIPQLLCVSPNFPKDGAEHAYYYVGKHDASGKPSETLSADNTLTLSNELFLQNGNCLAKQVIYDDYKELDSPGMEYGYVNGLLQLHTDNTMFFGEDISKAKRYKAGDVATENSGVIFENYIQFYESAEDPMSVEDDTEWHFVAFVIQNDYMYSVIDGETVVDQTTNGATGFFASKSFNMGTGLMASAGFFCTGQSACEADGRYYYNANRTGKSIMEWLTADTTKLNIGGASLEVAAAFNGGAEIATTAGTQIACVKLYNEILDEDTIAAIYEANDGHEKSEPTDPSKTDDPTDPPKPSEPVNPSDTPKPSDPVNPSDTPKPSDPVNPSDTPKPSDPVNPSETPGPSDTPFVYGDTDGNGKVEANDALEVLKCVVKLKTFDETQTKAGDVNEDGLISAEDALNILKYVVKLIPALPVK